MIYYMNKNNAKNTFINNQKNRTKIKFKIIN